MTPDRADPVTVLAAHADPPPAHLTRLHERLEDEAGRDGLLDVAYTAIDSPVGALLLASTDVGLVRVAFEGEGHDAVLDTLATRIGPRVLRSPRRLAKAARELQEYFAGARTAFDLPLDFRLSTGFRREVQRHLPDIAYGQTRSYRQVAARVGRPGAIRAAATACATNPLPVVVPCHRVLRSDGSLGGYRGGLPAKSVLLTLERAV